MPRTAEIRRTTKETDIDLTLDLDGEGKVTVATGLGFYDHMLTALAFHARWNLKLSCKGDLHIDDHHTVEDVAIALGQAVDKALGDRSGIARFGDAHAPLDEALARVSVDFSGRPCVVANLGFVRPKIGEVATENLAHVFLSFGTAARMTLHVDVLRGDNDHHRAEAAFKALALALRKAVAKSSFGDVASTKGTVSA